MATVDDYIDAFNGWCATHDPASLKSQGGGMPWYTDTTPPYPVAETLAHIAVQLAAGLDTDAAIAAGLRTLEGE